MESTSTLIERSRGGDQEAMDALLTRYLPLLRQWARGRLPANARDLLNTEDLVQETLIKTMRGLERFDPRHSGAFQAYLTKAIDNRVRDEIRKVGRRPRRDGTVSRLVDPEPSPVEKAIGRQQLDRYTRALEALPEADREVIVCRIELGLPYREIAEMLGKPSADAARMAVGRAVLRLAERISRAG